MNLEEDNKIIKRLFIKKLIYVAFVNSLIFYLLYYLIELLSDGFVTKFYNLNYHLLLVIVFGILAIGFNDSNKKIIEDNEIKKTRKSIILEYISVIIITLISVLVIYYKTRDLGNLSFLISALLGLLIILVSYLIMKIDKK
ncbi:MAG: hypothetical protein U5L76_02470 [Patescibacteria group bacterium]|nr:hypothetical protein [Patescibacteria group bacterium]